MGDTTAIAWTDHTFNPWMGCTKVSPACDHCYAEALGKRTGRVEWGDDAERVVTSDAYWRNPLKWNAKAKAEGRRHRVFCASMADVFEDRADLLPHRARLFALIDETPWLDWQLLTKRPENVTYFMPMEWEPGEGGRFPPNVWIGTTIEDAERAEERIAPLDWLDVDGYEVPVLFLSCEPLLAPIAANRVELLRRLEHVDWVIVGGESGPHHRPLHVDAARDLRDACAFLDIPFFFKQVGGRTPHAGGDLLDGVAHKEFPRVGVLA